MHYAASSISSSYSATQRNSWGTLRGSTSRSCVTGKCSWGTLDRSTARSRAKHRECSWGTLRGSTPRSCASHRDGIDCYQIFIAKLVAWVAAKSSSSEEDTHTTWVATQSSPSQREHPMSSLCRQEIYMVGPSFKLLQAAEVQSVHRSLHALQARWTLESLGAKPLRFRD